MVLLTSTETSAWNIREKHLPPRQSPTYSQNLIGPQSLDPKPSTLGRAKSTIQHVLAADLEAKRF